MGFFVLYVVRVWKIFFKCICCCLGFFFKWFFLVKKCIYLVIYIFMKNIDKIFLFVWSWFLLCLVLLFFVVFVWCLGDGLLFWLLLFGLVLLWWVVSYCYWMLVQVLLIFELVWQSVCELFVGEFWSELVISLWCLVWGLFVGVVSGVVLGVWLGFSLCVECLVFFIFSVFV